jgi:hypothetical protein
LIVRELDRETVIFDTEQDRAFCLNFVPAQVWKLCDGEMSVASICALVRNEDGTPVDETAVFSALGQLQVDGLLDAGATGAHGMSRRELIRRAGVAAVVAVPMITAINVPSPAAAASGGCLHQGSACMTGSECCGNPAGHCGCCANGQCGICSGGTCQLGSVSTGIKCFC